MKFLQKIKQKKDSILLRVSTALLCGKYFLTNRTIAFADTESTGVTSIDKGLESLKTLSVGLVNGVGVIFLAWGVIDFATAYSAHDTTQQSTAIKKCVGGIIAIAVGSIIKLFA